MQLLPLGKRELFNKLISLKPSGLLWLAVVFSIISTEIIVIPLSIFFNGRLTYDFFVTGLVCASLVSLVVSYLLIHLINKVRDSEKEFRTIFESATDALFIIDMEGNIIDINRTAYSRLGYTKEEMLSMSISELDMQEAANTAPTRLEDVRRYGSGVFESAHRKKDGTSMPVEVNGMTIDFGGKSVIFSIVRDITERKKAEKDKDTLLQEIHHRVKNNMQIISSLLNIQARNIEDKQLLAIFQDCQNRIRAMALVHEELYHSKNLSKINVKHYLDALLQGLSSSLLKKADVRLIVTIDDIFFNIDTAIPCGLIVTELVTNSFKHAFHEQRQGEISVAIRQEDGTFTLSVKDNGAGLPEGLDTEKTTSLGFQLVRGLTVQLGGTIKIGSDRGTETIIVFKEIKPAGMGQ